MSESQSYKKRTVQVRSSARAHLADLRQQRINRRKAAYSAEQPCAVDVVSEVPGEPSDFETVAVTSPSDPTSPSDYVGVPDDGMNDLAVENAAMSEMGEDMPASESSVSVDAVVSDTPETSALSAQDQTVDAPLDSSVPEATEQDSVSEDEAQEAMPRDVASPVSGDSPDDEQVQTDRPEVAPSDLETLPGAGPGLVWMLQKCGIDSLEDLAAATPEQLSNDLGVVGQILDVSQWIDFAKK